MMNCSYCIESHKEKKNVIQCCDYKEPLIDVHYPNLRQYQIATEDDVIDVLSPEAPLIEAVEPAAPEDKAPGKSHVLYADKDRAEVQARLRAWRRGFDDT